ncbi:glycosyltransferase family A protein [uncultured Methanobrevibacter sp.]|nr:glycosyltransferase family A protein [uncultured Methanobrevibacter sp.]
MVEISVIIPAYNVEDYIGDCVNSIINQTFKDIKDYLCR